MSYNFVSAVVLTLVLTLVSTVSFALTVSNLNNSGPGSLRDAIANTPPDGTVDFSVAGTIVLSSELTIDKSLTIEGPGADLLTVSGGNSTRIFDLTLISTNIKISGIRIADGFYDAIGGAAITFLGVSFVTLQLDDCIVDGNTSTGNPGLGVISFIGAGNNLVINRCTFTNNSTIVTNGGAFGGVIGTGGVENTVLVNDSTFKNNLAQSQNNLALGGVVGLSAGNLDFSFNNCTFDSNRAISDNGQAVGGVLGDGAGDTIAKFTNCTFYNNLAECSGVSCPNSGGGAIGSVGNSDISFNFSTFKLNRASCEGAQCSTSGGDNILTFSNENISVANTILYADDPSGSCLGPIASLGYNIDNGGSCIDGTVMGDQPFTDPGLDPDGLQDNGGLTETIALLFTSPAVEMADPVCPSQGTDQRGVSRPQNSRCDIGAFELELIARPIPTISEWGLLAMAAAFGVIGILAVRKKQTLNT